MERQRENTKQTKINETNEKAQTFSFVSLIFVCFVFSFGQAPRTSEQERNRAYVRQQFTQNFRDLQLLSQGLLRDHEAGRLTPKRLRKDASSINKCAKRLRSLMTLGDLASKSGKSREKEINTPQEYDESIRRLAKVIKDFAHNPAHQNSKVFDTELASQAQTDLLTVINLSKVIESRAMRYQTFSTPAQ